MMLYEAIHYQTGEGRFTDTALPKFPEKPMAKNRSMAKLPVHQRPVDFSRTTSFVVGQKLRESKWFAHDELKIFCAVVETGFIVERKTEEGEEKVLGVAVWTPGYEKSKDAGHISIYSLKEHKGNFKVSPYPLMDFWPEGTLLRINNYSDKKDTANTEEVIRDQIKSAERRKQKWHNCEHFTYWCRYDQPQRLKHASENIKGINFGLYSGFAMFKRMRRSTNK